MLIFRFRFCEAICEVLGDWENQGSRLFPRRSTDAIMEQITHVKGGQSPSDRQECPSSSINPATDRNVCPRGTEIEPEGLAMKSAFLIAVSTLSLCPLFSAAETETNSITVTPEETDEILANPGMGWETFDCTSRQDKSLPDWIPSTVHYTRWAWADLEKQPGEINTELLDK